MAERRRSPGSVVAAIVLVGVAVALPLAVPETSGSFTASIANTNDVLSTKERFVCADTFAGPQRVQNAYLEYRLDESTNVTTATDASVAGNTGTYIGTNAKDTTTSPCANDTGSAWKLDGSSSGITTMNGPTTIATNFSLEAWFKTSTAQGKIIGFESDQTSTTAASNDKQLWIGASGKLDYGTYAGVNQILSTPAQVTDGQWHHVVATTSSTAGSVLYLDGVAVASDSTFVRGQNNYSGYWKIGFGSLRSGWPDKPANRYFKGSLRYLAAYSFVLTAGEVAADYSIGKS